MITAVLALMFFMCGILPANAMVPQVKLPEWQKTKVYISSWEPKSNKLTVCVELEAITSISEISCKMSMENQANENGKIICETIGAGGKKLFQGNTLNALNKSEKAIFKKEFNLSANTSDWLDINLRAKPDANELKEKINQLYRDNPSMLLVLKSEIDNIKNPIYIGKITPIMTRNDIALTSVKDSAPKLEKINNAKCYLWYPDKVGGKGFEAESLRTFSMSVASKNSKNVETIGNILIKRLSASTRPLIISQSSGESFMIPKDIAIDLISLDIATLIAYKTKNASFIERALESMKPSDIKLMLKYNLASLKAELGFKQEAAALLNELKIEYSAWPQLTQE